jgi:hypothetical protein
MVRRQKSRSVDLDATSRHQVKYKVQGEVGALGAVRPGRLRAVARLLGLTLLLPACGADFLWVDTMGKMPELVTTTTTASTTTTTIAAPPPPPVVRLPPPPRPARPKPPPPPPPPPPAPKSVPLPGDSPLTGIGVGGYATGHPALVVKIDNVGAARPQQGINEADVVFEEMVEGGFTRFAAVFHSTPADPVGPIRSARSTDVALLAPLYHPLFSYSGANRDFQKLIRESSMVDVGVDNFPGKYYRQKGRKAPQNLFSNTSHLHSLASPDAQAPPPLFSYRGAGTRPSEPGARPISRASAKFFFDGKERTNVSYDWDAGTNSWTRIQNNSLHVDSEGRKVAPTNVIFQFVNYKNTGYVDSSGAKVPEADVVGAGDAWILSAGYLVPVRWEKRDHNDVTVFRGQDGRYARLLPGRTWVELIPPPIDKATFAERPADANDEAKPVAPPLADGTGPSPPETTTTTTGPSGSTTTTQPEDTTTTTEPIPVTTSTLPPVPVDPEPSSSSSSTTDTSERKSQGKKNKDGDKESAAPASTTSSSSVASGPASAALIGLLLLLAPWPGQKRRPRRR